MAADVIRHGAAKTPHPASAYETIPIKSPFVTRRMTAVVYFALFLIHFAFINSPLLFGTV